jgi:ATP-dependent 26S proteasome regulatory subunit
MSKLISAILSPDTDMENKRSIAEDARPSSMDERRAIEYALGMAEDNHRLKHENKKFRSAMEEVVAVQAEFKAQLDKLCMPPWFPATFVKMLGTLRGDKALVMSGNQSRVVEIGSEVDVSSLGLGDSVLLNEHQNIIMERSVDSSGRGGILAKFDRWTDDGRAIIRFREEEVVCAAGPLKDSLKGKLGKIKPGDLVRWDENIKLAFERFESESGKEFLLQEAPAVGRETVGGQDDNLDRVLSFLTMAMVAPEKAKTYGISGKGAMLMIGPPGTGKTLMARVAAYELSKIGKKKVRFGVVKPGEWLSPYVGVTEAHIRNCFSALKESTKDGGYAVLFLDEIESIGRLRGTMSNVHSDRFLASLIAEMEGFSDRQNVAVIAATNRKDLLDPALLERMSELEVFVGRPNEMGARAIFCIHLPADVPFHANGSTASKSRDEAIEAAVSMMYKKASPVCVLRLGDGSSRTVMPADMVSGRLIEQVCRSARRRAFLRDVREGKEGVLVQDVEDAVVEALARMSTTVSPMNAHSYIPDIPVEARVVRVDPIVPGNKSK